MPLPETAPPWHMASRLHASEKAWALAPPRKSRAYQRGRRFLQTGPASAGPSIPYCSKFLFNNYPVFKPSQEQRRPLRPSG